MVRGLYSVVYLILGLLMGLLTLLVGGGEETVEQPAEPPPAFTPPLTAETQTAEVPPWLGGTVFWVIVALLLGYAAYIYLQGRGVKFHLLLVWLRQFLHGLRQLQKTVNEWRASTVPPQDEEKARAGRARVRRWLDDLMLGRLPPDEQVRYFYVSTLERAAQQGIRRRPGETPQRFEARLSNRIDSEDETAIADLTAGFERVEFAQKTTTELTLPLLKRAWTQIRGALARLRPDQHPP